MNKSEFQIRIEKIYDALTMLEMPINSSIGDVGKIKSAYRNLAKKYHDDRIGDFKDLQIKSNYSVENIMSKINKAKKVVLDEIDFINKNQKALIKYEAFLNKHFKRAFKDKIEDLINSDEYNLNFKLEQLFELAKKDIKNQETEWEKYLSLIKYECLVMAKDLEEKLKFLEQKSLDKKVFENKRQLIIRASENFYKNLNKQIKVKEDFFKKQYTNIYYLENISKKTEETSMVTINYFKDAILSFKEKLDYKFEDFEIPIVNKLNDDKIKSGLGGNKR